MTLSSGFKSRSPLWLSLGFFFATLALHIPFAVFDAFGEQDAARIALAAQYGNLTGRLSLAGQWPFSTPGYIHLLYQALRHHWISGEDIVFVMAAASVVSSALFSAAFFLFTFNITLSLPVAMVMTLLVQLCPFFWLSSLYGFPTLVAVCLFMVSVCLFQWALSKASTARITGIVLSVLLFFSSVLCKVDTVTAAALFCLPLWQTRHALRQKIVGAIGLAMMAIAAFYLLNRYGVTLSRYEQAAKSWDDWTDSFYRGIGALFTAKNIEIISRAAGALSLPLAFAGAALAMRSKEDRTIAVWTLMTIIPITLFWSMMAGNSARHNLIPAIFATIPMALPLRFLERWSRWGWGAALLLVCTVNYFFWPPTASTVKPSGRLIASARELEARLAIQNADARRIPRMPHDRILVDIPNHLIPIYSFEAFVAPHLEFIKKGGGRIHLEDRATGKRKILYYPNSKRKRKALEEAKKIGYKIVRRR